MSWFKKLIKLPDTDKSIELEAAQLWRVSWLSRTEQFDTGRTMQFEAFTSEESAIKFREALLNAHKLIRNTSGGSGCISITKMEST